MLGQIAQRSKLRPADGDAAANGDATVKTTAIGQEQALTADPG